jgi:hypothetical protein
LCPDVSTFVDIGRVTISGLKHASRLYLRLLVDAEVEARDGAAMELYRLRNFWSTKLLPLGFSG